MQSVELDGNLEESWNNLGITLGDADRTDEAIDEFKQALSMYWIVSLRLYSKLAARMRQRNIGPNILLKTHVAM